MIAKAETMSKTLHYKSERTLSFEKFADKLKEMFNIYEKHGEAVTAKARIRILLDKVSSSTMQIAVQTIRTRVELDQNVSYEQVLNFLASQASTTQSRNVSEFNTHGGRGDRGGRGGRGRGGRGRGKGRGRGGGRGGRGGWQKPADWKDDDEFWSLSEDQRQKLIDNRRKKNSGGGSNALTKRKIQEITTEAVATTISAMITVDPAEEEVVKPSANAGDSFGGKRNQVRAKINKLKTAATIAQMKRSIMAALEID